MRTTPEELVQLLRESERLQALWRMLFETLPRTRGTFHQFDTATAKVIKRQRGQCGKLQGAKGALRNSANWRCRISVSAMILMFLAPIVTFALSPERVRKR